MCSAFEAHARNRYNDNINRANAQKKKPSQVNEVLWREWQDNYFNTPQFKEKSEKQRKNRKSEKAGPGTGMSIHTAGSRSITGFILLYFNY